MKNPFTRAGAPSAIVVGAAIGLCAFGAVSARAQNQPFPYPPKMEGAAEAVAYKTVGDVQLSLYVYQPAANKPSAGNPAIVFFFGGVFNTLV